ncbi:MAG: hypothetical protein IPH24_09710 [Crocinitomicaceae bacterium]|nr:hypothetical protein [Crocinitomicaceae bacterium]
MNIITMKAAHIPKSIAENTILLQMISAIQTWWKIVTMMHVGKSLIDEFLLDLHQSRLR